MRQRIFYLLKVYLLTVVVFIIAKVGFMWTNSGGHPFTMGDVCDVIRHGLTLDLSTSLYILILPFLITCVSIWWQNWILFRILRVYYGIIAFALALAFLADASLYPFWGFKLDAICLQYLETPAEIGASVSVGYLIVRAILLLAISYILYRFYVRISLWKWFKPVKHRIRATIIAILLIPLIVIGIRGGLDESTTNIGQVYYSQNQFLNHSAVNPVFNFLYSLDHQLSDGSEYQFMEETACNELVKDVFTTESIEADTLLNTQRPDIVVILLESCGEQFANVMPQLQKLKQEGIWFSQCYGNSWRTDRGTVCTLSGYPSFPSLSVMKMPDKSRTLPSIARTLQQEGYQTSFLYGGDINFTNMRSYLISTGWEKLKGKDDFSREEQKTSKWGVRDDITFNTLYNQLMQLPTDSLREHHALMGYSTLSSHEPWDVPEIRRQGDKETGEQGDWDEIQKAFYYLDGCLGDFINKLKATPQWKNLLIVLVADHGINYQQVDEQQPLLRNHIPLLWLGGAIKEPRTIDALCNQTDICATLLGQMGLKHDDFRFSRDVLSKSYVHPTAVHNYSNAQMLIDSTGYLLYDFDASHITVSQCTDQERLLRLNKAILQTTVNDLKER